MLRILYTFKVVKLFLKHPVYVAVYLWKLTVLHIEDDILMVIYRLYRAQKFNMDWCCVISVLHTALK
jgi:hypothetical protein